jgi:hypothetical protein
MRCIAIQWATLSAQARAVLNIHGVDRGDRVYLVQVWPSTNGQELHEWKVLAWGSLSDVARKVLRDLGCQEKGGRVEPTLVKFVEVSPRPALAKRLAFGQG